MMRIDYINDKFVCVADDWNRLERNERLFFVGSFAWEGFDSNGHLKMYEHTSNLSNLHAYSRLLHYAELCEIAITDTAKKKAQEMFDYYTEQVNINHEKRLREEQARFRKETWERRKRDGCGMCKNLLKTGDCDFKCKYSGDMLNTMFYDEYNPITNVYEMFHETGVPNEHCKDFVSERQTNIY